MYMKSKNRKKFFSCFVIMIVLTLFFGTGFTKRSDVWLVDHHVSEDGSIYFYNGDGGYKLVLQRDVAFEGWY